MMLENIEEWTIVITGSWNVNIFQPDWMLTNLGLEEIVRNVILLPDRYEVQISSNNLVLIPRPDRLVIHTKSSNDTDVKSMQNIAAKILSVLPHTPINGIGINFSFEDLSPQNSTLKQFDQNDDSLLSQLLSASATTVEIRRSFPIKKMLLNYMLKYSQNKIVLSLNYHSDVKTAREARIVLKNNAVIQLRNNTCDLIKSLYPTEE